MNHKSNIISDELWYIKKAAETYKHSRILLYKKHRTENLESKDMYSFTVNILNT